MSEYELELYKIIGNMIRDERIRSNITLEQVAAKIGVTPKTVQRYECGERKIKISTIMEIADMLGLDYNTFMAEAKSKLAGDPVSEKQYYLNNETAQLAQEIYENKELGILLDASRKLNKEDLEYVVNLVERLKGNE